MKRVSTKRAAQLREYKRIRIEFLEANPDCQICGGVATEIHHTNKRNGERLIDTKYFMALDRKCHNMVHHYPEESKKRGWLI